MKEYKNIFNKHPKAHPFINFLYTEDEIHGSLKCTKNGEAAGIEGIYTDMITHLGTTSIVWLTYLFETIKNMADYPMDWRYAKVVAILKPGKPADDPPCYHLT